MRTWIAYRRAKGWAVPRVLHALSGEMNTVRMVFVYPDMTTLEAQAAAEAADTGYARVAMAMPFDGAIEETIFRLMDEDISLHNVALPAGIGCAPGT
jgi:hypothetical protein